MHFTLEIDPLFSERLRLATLRIHFEILLFTYVIKANGRKDNFLLV